MFKPLTKEQYEKAIKSGYSHQQIMQFETERKRKETTQQPQQKQGLISRGLQKGADIATKIFDKPAQALFGSFGKSAGTVITGGIASGAELLGKEKVFGTSVKRLKATEEKITKGDIAFTALEMLPAGALTKSLKALPGGKQAIIGLQKFLAPLSKALRDKATKQLAQVLGATTKKFKGMSEKVSGELAERKVTALTRKGLESKALTQVSELGRSIDDLIKGLPKETVIKTKPILNAIQKTKNKLTVKGVVVEPEKLKVANKIQDIVVKFGKELDVNNMIELRRIWDTTIAEAGSGFGLATKEKFATTVKKAATNAIRSEVGKISPDIAKINKEFSFWKNVQEVISETIKRTASKGTSFAAETAETVGRGAGLIGGTVKDAILVGSAFKNANKLFKSTAWRTMSAKQKTKFADIIARGNLKEINEYAKNILQRVPAVIKNLNE